MKIIDQLSRTVSLPLTLGEFGRGRRGLRVSQQPGVDPSDCGYAEHGGLLVLTRPKGQAGCLLLVSSRGTYTKSSHGDVSIAAGSAKELASGQSATGAAGLTGGSTDHLLHVTEAVLVSIYLQGGEYKGYGQRLLLADASGVLMYGTPDQITRDILEDRIPGANARLTRLLPAVEGAPRWLQSIRDALALYQQMEDDEPCVASDVTHVIEHDYCAIEELRAAGFAIGPDVTSGQGVEINDGLVVPGGRRVVAAEIDCGGGKRWSVDVEFEGLDVIWEECLPRGGRKFIALIREEEWSVAAQRYRDGDVDFRLRVTEGQPEFGIWG